MKQTVKRIAVLFFTACLLCALSSCNLLGETLDAIRFTEEDARLLVRGNIDTIYRGEHDPAYLQLIGETEAEAEADYLAGLAVEAEYFTLYWGIVDSDWGESFADLSESFREELIALYDEIYSHTSYEIENTAFQTDGTYIVTVSVRPIDIMRRAEDLYINDSYAPLNTFWNKYTETEISTMSDAEYTAYTHEYGQVLVRMMRDLLTDIGYEETETVFIRVERENGVYTVNEEDWQTFDSAVIYYP